MGAFEQLAELRDWLSDSVREIFEAALAIEEPAGRSPEWDALCARYGVTPIDDAERQQVRRAQRPHRGAPVMELGPLVSELCRQGRYRLRYVGVDAEPRAQALYDRLQTLLDRTDQELVAAYKRAVLPKSGGMFAHVFSSPAASAPSGPAAHSLRCKNCGAPRLGESDFTCGFCDQQMV